MLGLEKSTITGSPNGEAASMPGAAAAMGTPSRGSASRSATSATRASGRRVKLMKPGPAIWGGRQRAVKAGSAASWSTIAVATARGGCCRGRARARAPLA